MNSLEKLSETISNSTDPAAFSPVFDFKDQQFRQLRSLERLMERRGSSNGTERYLFTYDACMRIAEAAALECSFAFGDHAHVGFRLVVSALTPHTGENLIRMITSARHAAKKEGVQPPHDLAKHLDTLLVDLQRSATELGIMR